MWIPLLLLHFLHLQWVYYFWILLIGSCIPSGRIESHKKLSTRKSNFDLNCRPWPASTEAIQLWRGYYSVKVHAQKLVLSLFPHCRNPIGRLSERREIKLKTDNFTWSGSNEAINWKLIALLKIIEKYFCRILLFMISFIDFCLRVD